MKKIIPNINHYFLLSQAGLREDMAKRIMYSLVTNIDDPKASGFRIEGPRAHAHADLGARSRIFAHPACWARTRASSPSGCRAEVRLGEIGSSHRPNARPNHWDGRSCHLG